MPGHFALWVHYGEAASKSTKGPGNLFPLRWLRGPEIIKPYTSPPCNLVK